MPTNQVRRLILRFAQNDKRRGLVTSSFSTSKPLLNLRDLLTFALFVIKIPSGEHSLSSCHRRVGLQKLKYSLDRDLAVGGDGEVSRARYAQELRIRHLIHQ